VEDRRLAQLACLAVALTGVLLIHFSGYPPKRVDALSPELLGEKIILEGRIDSARVHDGHLFLTVNGFKAVVFKSTAGELGKSPSYFEKGRKVALLGHVREYKGTMELVVEGLGDAAGD